jgi:hypothetical protein
VDRPIRPRVMTASDAAMDPSVQEDSYLAKVVRYIPGEIVAAYLAAYNALKQAANIDLQTLLWIVSGVLLFITPFWILFATRDPNKPRPYVQAVGAMFGFAIWVFAMPDGPFSFQTWYRPVYGSLVLILGTFLMPLLEKLMQFLQSLARRKQP